MTALPKLRWMALPIAVGLGVINIVSRAGGCCTRCLYRTHLTSFTAMK